MEITVSDYSYFYLENESLLVNAIEFKNKRGLNNCLSNFGKEKEYDLIEYKFQNHFKVDKSIKIKELSLENRMEFLNLINKSNKYQKYDMNDCMDLINKSSGLFVYEKEYVGSYILNNNIVENVYAKMKLDLYIKKLINKFDEIKFHVMSTDLKLINILDELSYVEKKIIKTIYKL